MVVVEGQMPLILGLWLTLLMALELVAVVKMTKVALGQQRWLMAGQRSWFLGVSLPPPRSSWRWLLLGFLSDAPGVGRKPAQTRQRDLPCLGEWW